MKNLDRRALLTTGGALTLAAGSAYAFTQGMPMMYELTGGRENLILANLIEESLRQRPDGTGHVRGSPCSTPRDFYDAIVAWHPNVGLNSVAGLPAFLRALIRRNPISEGFTGEYVMSRMFCGRPGTRQSGDSLDLSGSWRRRFRANEFAWFHPNHNFPIMAGDCANIVKPPEEEVPDERCVTVTWNAIVGGKVRWGVGTASRPLPPHHCNAIRQGDGPWEAWNGECDECTPNYGYIRRQLGGQARVPHRYIYDVTAARQTLRFSTDVWNTVVYICLEAPDGVQRTCGVYINPGNNPGDWANRYEVVIPDELWLLDDGNCPI